MSSCAFLHLSLQGVDMAINRWSSVLIRGRASRNFIKKTLNGTNIQTNSLAILNITYFRIQLFIQKF